MVVTCAGATGFSRPFSIFLHALICACCAILLVACGSGSSSTSTSSTSASSTSSSASASRSSSSPATQAVTCETSDDDSDSDQCGSLLLSLAGVEGDFLRYRVRLASLRLRGSDGPWVEVMPEGQFVDFARFNALHELAAAATLPVGSYDRAELTLDYRDAEILLDVDGIARPTIVVGASGEAVEEVTLSLRLDRDNPLILDPAAPAPLTLALDLESSHIIDPLFDPAVVAVVRVALFPVLIAEVDPLRPVGTVLRGPLIGVDESANTYRIAVRPDYLRAGRFGGLDVLTDSDTVWHINGATHIGAAGLSVLAELDEGIETLAQGRYLRAEHRFVADTVLVGSSIPGINLDAVEGHVLARTEDDRIFIQGARLWLTGLEPVYRDIVEVQLERTTEVFSALYPEERVPLDRISIGQRVRILGQWDEDSEIIEARRAELLLTRLTAIGEALDPLTLDAFAVAFGRWPADWFNYLGTGSDAGNNLDNNSNPNAYQVDVTGIDFEPLRFESGAPLAVWGMVSPFGSAPPDFLADYIQDFRQYGARLLVNWVPGTPQPFSQFDPIGVMLNPNATFGIRHDLRFAALVTDIVDYDELPVIAPVTDDQYERGIYVIAQRGHVSADLVFYSSFSSFVADLSLRLNRGATVRYLHGRGGYLRDRNRFVARGLSVLLDPVDD